MKESIEYLLLGLGVLLIAKGLELKGARFWMFGIGVILIVSRITYMLPLPNK